MYSSRFADSNCRFKRRNTEVKVSETDVGFFIARHWNEIVEKYKSEDDVFEFMVSRKRSTSSEYRDIL